MFKTRLFTSLNLHLFEGEGGGAAAPSGAEASVAVENIGAKAKPEKNPLAKVQYGKVAQVEPTKEPAEAQPVAGTPAKEPAKEPEVTVTTDTQEAHRAEFEKLIKGEYKDIFHERTQKIIDTRFKETKALESQVKSLSPVLEMLASKYGIDGSDADALAKAITEDNSYYEDEALQKGLTVEQLKHVKSIERENAELKRTTQEIERRQNADRVYTQWEQQSKALKETYPNFDLKTECADQEVGQRFLSLLKSGIDVKTAYEVVHKDEIISGAMSYTAQQIQQKTVNDIRTRGLRPAENGVSGSAAAIVTKSDPKTFTKKDRDEISRRVMRGERIEF